MDIYGIRESTKLLATGLSDVSRQGLAVRASAQSWAGVPLQGLSEHSGILLPPVEPDQSQSSRHDSVLEIRSW